MKKGKLLLGLGGGPILIENDHEETLQRIYIEWLMEYCPEDFSCKDQLIELEENRHQIEEF